MRSDARRNRERILAAAEEVFAAGPDASTEEVARRAGVAIGTVFRHFPTKADLLRALMKRLLQQVTDDAAELIANGNPAGALLEFFARLVERTAANRAVVSLLAAEGTEVPITGPLGSLSDAVGELLVRGQEAGAIAEGVRLDEVIALLVSACQGALHGGWDADLRRRTLGIMFAGLRPAA
ncbi:TetR/AcrR family transcriptional regulator [Actinomadura mexicana]|uniref:Transcriptional regulator, TetR family n=1 Tax=Actinomadura mexicana TaxID=134959 RepID=A0A238YNH2_9ACTN|nr:TetR/AcrR family transcriptional regulator [Actinomadura mexicana]SNR72562.1 transcriptional regulator, TetR family [Actinomadura mexicana]